VIDLFALCRTNAQTFGLFMSVHPVLAALVGSVALGQHLGHYEGAGSQPSFMPTS
jgi:inner membrane transporter RhtA